MVDTNRFIIDLQVTGICNMRCNFCCGAPRDMPGAEFIAITSVIDKLAAAGLDTLVISGGEPLMRADTPDIIAYAAHAGLEVYLSTNGLLLPKYYTRVEPYLSYIGLPLDGSSPEMNRRMGRLRNQFASTINLLRRFKVRKPSAKIKVGTVVSKVNIGDMLNIGALLFESADLMPPNTWRLYQFTPLGEGVKSRAIHEISDETFATVCQAVMTRFPTVSVVPLSNANSNDSYIFINPDLTFIVLSNDQYLEVGNACSMTISEIQRLRAQLARVISRGNQNRAWLQLRMTADKAT